jgi:GEVED domain/FG-GAP-like repeat/Cadherin domain/FG-GAP repeat
MRRSNWFSNLRTTLTTRCSGPRANQKKTHLGVRRAMFELLEDRRLLALDYGDAPDPLSGTGSSNYSTLSTDNGPNHTIVVGLKLGAYVDGDGGALQNLAANADDVNGALPDDEDGLTIPAIDLALTVGAQPRVNVRVTNTTGSLANLYGWIDYNANGVFENVTEFSFVSVPAGINNGIVTLVFPSVPIGFTGATYARFRLSTDNAAGNPTGAAADGEVEDYRVTITKPSDLTASSEKTRKIASSTSGAPSLANSDYFGRSVTAIGDVDGDGVADLAVGANGDDTGGAGQGAIHILFMNANGTIKAREEIDDADISLANGDYFGSSTASLGDLDGDGVPDIAVGLERADYGGTNRGAVYVVFLRSNGTERTTGRISDLHTGGPDLSDGDYFGRSVSSIGDFDGDGLTDLAIGAYGDDTGGINRGAIYLFFLRADGFGKSHVKIASGTNGGPTFANGDHFGSSVASIGDLDGDGVTDLAVSAVGDDTGGSDRGAVHILFMNADGTVKSRQKIASGVGGGPALTNGDQFGRSVAGVGDLDGDGVRDMAVGAYYDDTGGSNRGAIYLLLMNTNGTVKSSHKIASGVGDGPALANDNRFGVSISSLGDLDGDGIVDLAVGANFDDTGGTNRGAVHLLFLDAAPNNVDPVITSPATANVSENATAVMTVTATDANLPPQTITFSIIGGADESKFAITSGGALSFISAPDFEAPTDANADNIYVVTVRADDGNGGTDTQTINVIVTPVNDNNPIIRSADSVEVPENTTFVVNVSATDADVPAQPLTYSIVGGADQAKFTIQGGALSFTSAPDYDVPTDADRNNIYNVIVRASDGTLTGDKAILVAVTPVNDNPPFFRPSTIEVNVAENTTAIMSVAATDADRPPQTLTYSILALADYEEFSITPEGMLSFNMSPDFEQPRDTNGDNYYVVVVQASDGTSTAVAGVVVTVTPVNDNSPVFTSPDSVSAGEHQTDVLTVTANDSDRPAQDVTFSVVVGEDQSKFEITANGVLSFISPPDFDTPGDANGDNIYVVVIEANDGHGRSATQTLQVSIRQAADFGDAPDAGTGTGPGNYHTVEADIGPSHRVVPGLRLGAAIDGDNGSLQNSGANADDLNGRPPDDEDGVTNPAADLVMTVGAQPTVNVRVTNTSGANATIYGWIDYNGNGVFENATERTSNPVPNGMAGGIVTLIFPVVPGGFIGNTYARFRLSTDTAAANSTGAAADGEVEDYRATIRRPSDGTAESSKTRKIASSVNGGPTLANGDMFGSSLAAVGDLDGDGVDDFAVGSPVEFGRGSSGEVHVLFMNANGTVRNSQKITSGVGGGPTLAAGDYFGHSMAALGDLDGDGVNDLIVGATKDDTGGYIAGAAYVLLMNPNGTVKASHKIASGVGGGPTLVSDDRFGSAMAPLGDLDGDGVIDMAVGALGDDVGGSARGAVYVFFMNSDGTVKSTQKIASNMGGGPMLANLDVFGSSIASLGDIDGDGVVDMAVGAVGDDTGGDSRGAVHILFMNSDGTVKSSERIASGVGGGPILANGDRFSRSLASPGDLDGDGIADLAVGAYQDDTGGNSRGAVHMLFLNSDGTVKSSRKIANATGGGPILANYDNFGGALASLGDLDGDGVTELAVGAERDDTGGNSRGAAYVLFLKRGNSNPVFTSPTMASVPENSAAVMPVTATDSDVPPQTIVFSIVGGADQARFSISSNGALSFISPPDFEAPSDTNGDKVYEVAVQASDGNGGTAMQTVSITVTPINDNIPVFTSADVVSVPENSTAVTAVTATDADVPAQVITFSIAGGADQSRFMITGSGALAFKVAPDFEQPIDSNGDNVYVVIVQASDGGLTNLQAMLVTVSNVNELPGDYNLNGIVDTADFVLWRRAENTMIVPFNGADGDGDGIVDQNDYLVWRANFGRTLPSGAGTESISAAISAESGATGEPTNTVPVSAASAVLGGRANGLSDAVPPRAGAAVDTGRRQSRSWRMARRDPFELADSHDTAILAWLLERPEPKPAQLDRTTHAEWPANPVDQVSLIELGEVLDVALELFGASGDTLSIER